MDLGELRFKRNMQRTLCIDSTLYLDSYRMSDSLKGFSLSAEGRIDDKITKPSTAKDAAKKKKKKKSERKDSQGKSKKDACRAIPESLMGLEVSWSRSYLESTDELPVVHDDLVRSTKPSHRDGHCPKPFDESQTSALSQDIVIEDLDEVTVENLDREKNAATIVLDPNGFPLDESATSLDLFDLFDLKDQDKPHINSPRSLEKSSTLDRMPHPESESHLLDSFASQEKSLTLSNLHDSLTSTQQQDSKDTTETYLSLSHLRDSHTSMHLQGSNTAAEKSLALTHIRNSHLPNDMENKQQESTQSCGASENFSQKSGPDAKAAFSTASAFEAFLRQQHGLQKTNLSGFMSSSSPGYEQDADDSSSDGDWDDPFSESKFWGSESMLHIGDDDEIKSFRDDSDAWASFGRIRRNETFFKRVSSKDMNCSTPSTRSTKTKSPERSGEDGTLKHGNLAASQSSVRSFSALNPQERTVKQQLASLSLSQQACISKLKAQWEEYDGGSHVFPDEWYLRFARCSPGNPFNVKSAWKVMKRVECRYFDLQMSKMEKSVRSKIIFPVPGLKTKSGRDVFYMRPGRFLPMEAPTDTFVDLLVYTMNCMLEKEHGSVHGLGLVANMTGWKMENFSVPYWHKFLMTLQGYHVPTRISLFLIVSPPCWFGSIWKIMKSMMSADFQKKVAVISLQDLDKYLMDGFHRYLPDDLDGGKVNTDALVNSFIVERKTIESEPL